MGMYTEFVGAIELKKDTPKEVIDILEFMVNDKEEPKKLPNDELFKCDRWKWMLRCDNYSFVGITNTMLVRDEFNDSYYLTIRCSLKNYDSEIEKFCKFIKPYTYAIDGSEEFIGYIRYEESNKPTLIYYENMDKLLDYESEEN